jgi:hypothetical protein
MDNKSVPTELTESCKRIINSKTVALAEQALNLQFESRGLDMVSFPTGYTSNMYNGILLWSSMDTPSNHSPFTFSEAEPIQMSEQMNCHLTLQLILTQGKGMTVDENKAANKQEVNAPMSFNNMTMQLNMFTVANDRAQCQIPMPPCPPNDGGSGSQQDNFQSMRDCRQRILLKVSFRR